MHRRSPAKRPQCREECVTPPRFGDADDWMSADVRAQLVAALRQLDIYDVAQPNPAPRLEESLQDGCDPPPVPNGVALTV